MQFWSIFCIDMKYNIFYNSVASRFLKGNDLKKMKKRTVEDKKMIKKYEIPELKLQYLTNEDVLTESEEAVFSGDGWVKDPFDKE